MRGQWRRGRKIHICWSTSWYTACWICTGMITSSNKLRERRDWTQVSGAERLRIRIMFHIDHLGIAVSDLRQACSFYELLGMPVGPAEFVEHEQVRAVMVQAGER